MVHHWTIHRGTCLKNERENERALPSSSGVRALACMFKSPESHVWASMEISGPCGLHSQLSRIRLTRGRSYRDRHAREKERMMTGALRFIFRCLKVDAIALCSVASESHRVIAQEPGAARALTARATKYCPRECAQRLFRKTLKSDGRTSASTSREKSGL